MLSYTSSLHDAMSSVQKREIFHNKLVEWAGYLIINGARCSTKVSFEIRGGSGGSQKAPHLKIKGF